MSFGDLPGDHVTVHSGSRTGLPFRLLQVVQRDRAATMRAAGVDLPMGGWVVSTPRVALQRLAQRHDATVTRSSGQLVRWRAGHRREMFGASLTCFVSYAETSTFDVQAFAYRVDQLSDLARLEVRRPFARALAIVCELTDFSGDLPNLNQFHRPGRGFITPLLINHDNSQAITVAFGTRGYAFAVTRAEIIAALTDAPVVCQRP